MKTTNELLLSLFGVAIVTALVLPGRPVSTAIASFATALANSIRALMGTQAPGTGVVGKNISPDLFNRLRNA